jgi:hypothetical protein
MAYEEEDTCHMRRKGVTQMVTQFTETSSFELNQTNYTLNYGNTSHRNKQLCNNRVPLCRICTRSLYVGYVPGHFM